MWESFHKNNLHCLFLCFPFSLQLRKLMEQSRRLSRRGRQRWWNRRVLINTKILHTAADIHSSYFIPYVVKVPKPPDVTGPLWSLCFYPRLWWRYFRRFFCFSFFSTGKSGSPPRCHYTATYLAILPQRVTNFCPGRLGMSSSKSYLRLWTLAAETTEIQSKSNLACDWLLRPPLN